MKIQTLPLFLLIAFCCLLETMLFAQQKQNPFDNKKKIATVQVNTTATPTVPLLHSNIQLLGQQKPNMSFSALVVPTKTQAITLKTSAAQKNVDRLEKTVDQLRINYSKTNQTPIFIKGKTPLHKASLQHTKAEAKTQAAFDFLSENQDLLQIKDAKTEFQFRTQTTDDLGQTHIRLDQYYQGIPVWASDVVVHLKDNGVSIFNGRYQPTPNLNSVEPKVQLDKAVQKVEKDLETFTKIQPLSHKIQHLMEHSGQLHRLVVFPHPVTYETNLAWHITYFPDMTQRWEYFVDAETGELLFKYNNTCHDGPATAQATDLYGNTQTIHTYESRSTYYLVDANRSMFDPVQSVMPDDPVGGILTLDARNTRLERVFHYSDANNNWNNERAGVSAHHHAGICYEYFRNNFNRNSLDGRGGTIISIVDVAIPDNAGWNGHFMMYGIGQNAFNGSLAKGLDVAGHEMTHGVIENTANLVYMFQSGALNESYADVFGVAIEDEDWRIGEDVVKTSVFPTGAMRDMKNPNNGGRGTNGYQPATMAQYENLSANEDNGGVHINSGIPNHIFYLFADQVGIAKAQQVYYRSLANYLTQSSQFLDARLAVVQSTEDLYTATEVNAARGAFNQTGLRNENEEEIEEVEYETELPSIEGAQHILIHDLFAHEFTLSNIDLANETVDGLITTAIARKPSVVEDGSVAAFVATDGHAYAINLDPNNPDLEPLTEDPEWGNIAVSKDGTKVALVKSDPEPNIYVFDLTTGTRKIFELYNPSTANGDNSAGAPRYADVLEWDIAGEELLYDAFNVVDNNTGDNIEYWDVGLIKVWDNDANNFAEGTVFKVFNSLPDGVNVGNATFSKNSPHIISFDYIDGNNNEVLVMAGNLETGESDVIFTQSILGYPNYAIDDDVLAFSAENVDNQKIVATIPLAPNKISRAGDASVLLTDAEWPLWYAKGSRQFTAPSANFTSNLTSTEGAITINFFDQSTNTPTSWLWEFEGGNPSTSTKQNPIVSYNQSGVFDVTLTSTNPSGNDTERKNGYISILPTAIANTPLSESIQLYPNPSSTQFTLDFNHNSPTVYQMEVMDITGKLVLSQQINIETAIHQQSFDVAYLSEGLYLIRLANENGAQQYPLVISR